MSIYPRYVHELTESCKISIRHELRVKVNAFYYVVALTECRPVRTGRSSSNSESRVQRYKQKSEPPSDSEKKLRFAKKTFDWALDSKTLWINLL